MNDLRGTPPVADRERKPVFDLVRCGRETCDRRYALVFVLATHTTAVFAAEDTEHIIAQVAGTPCCVKCGGELVVIYTLAAQASDGRWIRLDQPASRSWRLN